MIKWDIFQGCKDDSASAISQQDVHMNKMKDKNHHHLICTEKAFNIIQHPFMIKLTKWI